MDDGCKRCLPISVNHFDDGAEGAVADDALGARAYGFDKGRFCAVPSTECPESEGLTHPQHVVAITLCLLFGIGVELSVLQFQSLLVFSIEVECLTGIEIDADAVQFAFEINTVVVLDVIGIGSIAPDGN